MKENLLSRLLLLLFLIIGMGCTAYGQSSPDSIVSQKVAMFERLKDQASLIKSFIPQKKKDTVYVLVTNITFSDPNLTLLKGAISKGKDNVRSLFQEGTVILKVIGKKDAGAVYEALDASIKKMFEPSDIGDAQMILTYKSPLVK